jgi:hypothetical protein
VYFKYRKNIRNNPGSETWDDKTSLNLFDYQLDASATYGNQDLKNSIVFSDYGDSNVIAVTSIWYYPSTKAIVEFDMLFNDAFDWATDGDTTKMDLQNIATYEFGHTVGLADLYTDSCKEVTMGIPRKGILKREAWNYRISRGFS